MKYFYNFWSDFVALARLFGTFFLKKARAYLSFAISGKYDLGIALSLAGKSSS
jgi:hypothetical protein